MFLSRPEKSETPNLGNDYMNTPGTDSNESPRKRSRISSVATPALQLPNDKNPENHSMNRPSEFDPHKNSTASLHRSRMPPSIEEEKLVNNVVDD